MEKFIVFVLLTNYAFWGVTSSSPAFADDVGCSVANNDADGCFPVSLLQTGMSTNEAGAHNSELPATLLGEQAATGTALAQVDAYGDIAPFDVGSNSVPLPDDFESQQPWTQLKVEQLQQQHERKNGALRSAQWKDTVQHAARAPSRPAGVVLFSAPPAREQSTDIHEDSLAPSQVLNDASAELHDLALSEVSPWASFPQAGAALPMQASEDAIPEMSLEEVMQEADFDNMDQGTASVAWSSKPVGSLNQIKATRAREEATSHMKGHSKTLYNSHAGEEGEWEGEREQIMTDPALLKMMFAKAPESMLKAQVSILEAQNDVAATDMEAKTAMGRLKAEAYHSANMSQYRQFMVGRLEVAEKREGLLADANRYKAFEEKAGAEKAQAREETERQILRGGEYDDREKGRLADAERQLHAEILRYQQLQADMAPVQNEIVNNQVKHESARAKAVVDLTDDMLRMNLSATDVNAAYEKAVSPEEIIRQESPEAKRQQEQLRVLEEHRRYLDMANALVAQSAPSPLAASLLSQRARVSPVESPLEAVDEYAITGLNMGLVSSSGGNPMTATYATPKTEEGSLWTPAATELMGNAVHESTSADSNDVDAYATAGVRNRAFEPLGLTYGTVAPLEARVSSFSFTHDVASIPPNGRTTTPCPSWQSSPPEPSPGLPLSQPTGSHCTPQCTWKCETPVCEEVCEPVCKPSKCETRCSSPDISGCSMQCDEPQCAIMCPERQCPGSGCPTCVSNCTEPLCTLRCPERQPCRNLCEQPECEWKCRKPEACPQPKCKMVCEHARDCGSTMHHALPPLVPGEVSVNSFSAPASLLATSHAQRASSHRIRVPVTRAVGTRALRLPHEHDIVDLPISSRTPFPAQHLSSR